jgi:hypothetical protein
MDDIKNTPTWRTHHKRYKKYIESGEPWESMTGAWMAFQLLKKVSAQGVPEKEWIETCLSELETWENERAKERSLGKNKGRAIRPKERLRTVKNQWKMFEQWKLMGVQPD